MNQRQKKVIVTGVTLCVAMALFPPFSFQGRFAVQSVGHFFILAPEHHAYVDVSALLGQWIAVGAATALICLRAKNDDEASHHPGESSKPQAAAASPDMGSS